MNRRVALSIHLAAGGFAALTLPASASSARTQDGSRNRSISQPAMPLDQALRRIADAWDKPLDIDADATKDLTARPVVDARNMRDAVRQATRGLGVVVTVDDDGIAAQDDIVVTAQRDEAETNVMVRGDTTSSRLGQSLRNQPRNTQVISAKLLEEQQALTLSEALANAGGVVVNGATVQGGVGYSVRGFSSNGSVNGLPSTSSSSFAAGSSQPLANIERIEVLKGPDAILLGGDNLGGTINIVTKKPSAEERLYVSFDTGSFGLARGTIDANRALTDDKRVSARIIASAATASRNFGGYRGNQDYLFAPSLRFKNGVTDLILSATIGSQVFGAVPYAAMNQTTREPYDVARDRPLIGGKDQGYRMGVTQFNAEFKQKLTDWVTVVLRGQHQDSTFELRQYSPFTPPTAAGIVVLSASGVTQQSNTDALDGFARFNVRTGPFKHTVVAGFTYIDGHVTADNAVNGSMFQYNFLTPTAALPLRPLATNFTFGNSTAREQRGRYGQYLLDFWKVHLLAGFRRNSGDLTTNVARIAPTGTTIVTTETKLSGVTTPNYGAVVDVTDNLSVFGTLAYGFLPTLVPDRFGNRLPDVRSRNAETGIKWDLFDKAVYFTGSWFSIRQSNILIADPVAPRFQIAVPGQLGRGIDINVSGTPLPGLTITGAFTRTKYQYLTPSATLGNVVFAQPRDVYNVYGSYTRPIAPDIKAGLGAGVSGRSRAAVDRRGLYYIPPAVQVALNGFLTVGDLNITAGIRNLFDRRNYGTTNAVSYIPLGEPRSWRLSVGYRFF